MRDTSGSPRSLQTSLTLLLTVHKKMPLRVRNWEFANKLVFELALQKRVFRSDQRERVPD